MFTWRQLKQYLAEASDEQLDKPVLGLIDHEPWKADCYQIADHDDSDLPNQPYLLFI